MSVTDQCARCGGDCPMTRCPECGGCENTGTQPCPACQPPASDREMDPCEICADPEPCECDDPGECDRCYGSGECVPEHCCLCGGSPYCTCCRTCGECVGTCKCPMTVQLAGGGTLTLEGATGEGQ
jgi:hypothetical protein